ncbi:MAG TPA: tetratricopeptide repeat protein [Gemmataceae bacterium]|nr:tetratricopeptide repeat protein [Gemmataceae bacterium]
MGLIRTVSSVVDPAGKRGRCDSILLLALGVFFLVAWPMSAQGQALLDTIREADKRYGEDKLLEAEALYRQALNRAAAQERRHCFERLLAIYVRVGREDQAIQIGLSYADWLRAAGDLVRAREVELDLGRWYFALGHYAETESHLRRSLVDLKDAPLPPARQVTALTYLALAAEKAGDRKRAAQAWRVVETFARARLDDKSRELDVPARIECVRRLADSYRFQGRHKEAIGPLEEILPVFDKLKATPRSSEARRDTLRQLAEHLTAVKRLADAEKRLREALALHEQHAANDRLTHGELACELADVLDQQGRKKDATDLREVAVKDYRIVRDDPRSGRPEVAGALSAFWKLQQLHQRNRHYTLALKLTHEQAQGAAGTLIEPRLRAEEGRLQVFLGDYAKSRKLLTDAVNELEKQSPLNLVELPTALLNLGVAEMATGDRGKASERGERCLKLYRQYHLVDDLVLIETYNLLGTCAAQAGDYKTGLDQFRAGTAICARLGESVDPQHCNLLLNMALLYKAQHDLPKALTTCQQARKVYERFARPEPLILAALDAAAAALLAAQVRLAEANELAGKVLDLCKTKEGGEKSLMATARHCQALFHLYRGNFAEAEKAWEEVKQLHGPKSPLQPRTLSYFALMRERQQRLKDAETLYREARGLQAADPQAFPATQFTTLWRLANVVDARAGGDKVVRAEARALLEEAITVVEKARLHTYGDAQQRAPFFEQFAPAFDQLVAWCARDGDLAAAVVAVARGRSRTLLDQLLMANVDPRATLEGPQGEQLRKQEKEASRRIAALRLRGYRTGLGSRFPGNAWPASAAARSGPPAAGAAP